MCTIPIESKYVNAVVFLIVDLLCFMIIIGSSLQKVQARYTRRRLQRGYRVHLRESRFAHFLPGILKDGLRRTRLLILSYLLLVLVVFLLTLTINGETEVMQKTISRQYITALAAAPFDYNSARLHPSVFSHCVETSTTTSSVTYYPTAFNTIENQTIFDRMAFRNKQGEPVPIDSESKQCQSFQNVPSLLTIPRCGKDMHECSNVEESDMFLLQILSKKNDIEDPWQSVKRLTTRGSGEDSLVLFHANVKPIRPVLATTPYNRLICLQRPLRGSRFSGAAVWFTCVLGTWSQFADRFTFRVGVASVSFLRWEDSLRQKFIPDVTAFQIMTTEAVLPWSYTTGGEDAIVNALVPVSEDTVSARSFLDGLVARALIAQEVSATPYKGQLFEPIEQAVTKIQAVGAWGYAVFLFATVATLAFRGWFLVTRPGGQLDITSYSGMLQLLSYVSGNEDWGDHQRGVSFSLQDGNVAPTVFT
ncbi:hypothetical protein BWQ96_06208 [Gracilariopsis chorda]|uniref:Uncharacterized protein n=1 Tax=Gracilariopsis chorda TaxID=448386 RepID=A0A2V3IPL9_9FLOR|nr:hypothetical protein BWQ96_06208 [Gracilariopsis chorda]|eukprot:PXF44035.1 hypothetical protein BWQ96_06208 [Gracilariopsis chorda]